MPARSGNPAGPGMTGACIWPMTSRRAGWGRCGSPTATGAKVWAPLRSQPGDIAVADNGYGYRTSIATAVRQQADVVLRITPATFPLVTAAGRGLRRGGVAADAGRRPHGSGAGGVPGSSSATRSGCWRPSSRPPRRRPPGAGCAAKPKRRDGRRVRPPYCWRTGCCSSPRWRPACGHSPTCCACIGPAGK